MRIVYFIIVLIGLILFFLVIYVVMRFLRYYGSKKKVETLFKNILEEHKTTNNIFKKAKNKPYDYYIETLTSIYYVKVIYNYNCYETSINSAYLWQYKVDINDDKIRFWPNVVDFVNLNCHNDKKQVYKLCLIYPNTRSLLYYLNESELAFVRTEEAVYGINFITYERLVNEHNFIEGR